MTEQQACTLCGAGGHTAAHCNWNKADDAPLYSEGICQDGAAILRDGVPVPVAEIIEMLNSTAQSQPSPAPELMPDDPRGDFRGWFEGWALENEHPVFGWLGADWLDQGDEPNTYGKEYIQGAWVMAMHLSGEFKRLKFLCHLHLSRAKVAEQERDAAQARLAELAQQPPIGWWAQYCETPMRRMVHWGAKLPECATDKFYPFYAAPVARAGQVPDGWKPVPIEPNEAMRDAIDLLCDDHSAFDDSEAFWRYLLAAAPAQGGE